MSFRDWYGDDAAFAAFIALVIGLPSIMLIGVHVSGIPDPKLVPPGYSIQERNGKYRWISQTDTGRTAASTFNDAARNAQAASIERSGWNTVHTGQVDKVEE